MKKLQIPGLLPGGGNITEELHTEAYIIAKP